MPDSRRAGTKGDFSSSSHIDTHFEKGDFEPPDRLALSRDEDRRGEMSAVRQRDPMAFPGPWTMVASGSARGSLLARQVDSARGFVNGVALSALLWLLLLAVVS